MYLKLNISDADRAVLLHNLWRMHDIFVEMGDTGPQFFADYTDMLDSIERRKDLDPTSVELVLRTMEQIREHNLLGPERAHQADTLSRIEADIKRDGRTMFKKFRMPF